MSKRERMENKINLRETMNPYLLQFNYAQLNLAKFIEEERKERRKRKHRWHPVK